VRLLLLASLTLGACASDTLDNTAYRRVVDQFASEDQCVAEGNFARCYDTLTFCADGTANASLDVRQEGHYQVSDDRAVAQLPTMTLVFDLAKQSSDQLPGRNAWELVAPLLYDCGP